MHGSIGSIGRDKRVLISTISPGSGGVPAMARFVISTLRERGYEPVLAHYEPYSVSPHLSVPSFRLLQRRAGSEVRRALGGCETHAMGAWLPELEFTHYLCTAAWKRLIDSCCAHLAVSGNALASVPYFHSGRPFISWIASGWHMDRKDRVQELPAVRRVFDRTLVSPIVLRLERSLLRAGSVIALSRYTQRLLDSIAGTSVVKDVLPVPVDTGFFHPAPDMHRSSGRIGFSGRLDDPRKNLELLLVAVRKVRQAGHNVSVLLTGGEPGPRLSRRIRDLGIGDAVEFCGCVPVETLRDKLRTLELFVIPSHQEGLCIAALEAMACGCPVVSTRCGGPEEFVLDGETGFLVDSDAAEMADAILRILHEPELRRRLGAGARDKVVRDYSVARASNIFWKAFDGEIFGVNDAVPN